MTSVHKNPYLFEEWLEAVAAHTGDSASQVASVYARYTRFTGPGPGDEILATFDIQGRALSLDLLTSQLVPLQLEIDLNGPRIVDGLIEAYGLTEVAPGLWALEPSLNIPGVLHAFVTLYAVTQPAPWERTVFLATEIPGHLSRAMEATR